MANPEGSYVGGVALTREEQRRQEGATEDQILAERNAQLRKDAAENTREQNLDGSGEKGISTVGGVSLEREAAMRAAGASEADIQAERNRQAAQDTGQDLREVGIPGEGPYGYQRGVPIAEDPLYGGKAYTDANGFTDFTMRDTGTYQQTRDAYAGRGWDPDLDERDFAVGRTQDGAQHLRDYGEMAGRAATSFADQAQERALDLGQARKASQTALGTAAEGFANTQGANILNGAGALRDTGIGYGDTIRDLGQEAARSGVRSGAAIRDTAAGYGGALRDVYANEGPSGAKASFGIDADAAILEAARTGNRSAAATSMGKAGMDSALMRASEYGDWQSGRLNNASNAGKTELSGLFSGAGVEGQGYEQAAALSNAGSSLGLKGTSAALGAKNTGYGTLMSGQQIGANADLSGNQAVLDSYGTASDAYFQGLDGVFGGSDLTQSVDEMELRGNTSMWDEFNRRFAATEAYKQKAKEAKDAEKMATYGLVGDGITTLASLA